MFMIGMLHTNVQGGMLSASENQLPKEFLIRFLNLLRIVLLTAWH